MSERNGNAVVMNYADADRALRGVQALLDYEHPTTRNGLKQDVSLALIKLRRELTKISEDYRTQQMKLFERYGEATDDGGYRVQAGTPARKEFNREIEELARATVEVHRTVRCTDLVCRDGNGEYVPIEPKGKAFDDLGALLEI